MHIFLPTYLGGTFSPLLDISERNFFPGGGGVRAPSASPPLRTRLYTCVTTSHCCVVTLFNTCVIIYMKKVLDSAWLRAVQLLCKNV